MEDYSETLIDRIIDKNGVKEAINNLFNLEWGRNEKPENFFSRFINYLNLANQTDDSKTKRKFCTFP